jgi:DNA-directed RNA polymerase subunit omega
VTVLQPPIEDVVERAGSRYAATVMVARRANQLAAGALPRVGTAAMNRITVAMQELAQGRLRAEVPSEAPSGAGGAPVRRGVSGGGAWCGRAGRDGDDGGAQGA